MGTITKISIQKKSKSRYNIFLDDKYAFSVDEDVLIRHHLHKGLQLSADDITRITENESLQRSYLLGINYLSYRIRTIGEMRTYLRGKEVEQPNIDKVIERLVSEGLLNDTYFADAFVKDRINLTSKGPQVIARELQEKGVKAEIAAQAVTQYTYDEQFTTALKWVKREQNKTSRQSYRKRNDQLRNKLMQKGFSRDVVTDVMAEAAHEMDKEEEYANIKREADKLYRRNSKKHEGYELQMKVKAGLYNRGFAGDLINDYMNEFQNDQK